MAGDWISSIPEATEELSCTGSVAGADLVSKTYRENHGSLVISHYNDGAIRWENVHSGVIREESADGSMTLSLPDGKIIRQAFEGGQLQVHDLQNPGPMLVTQIKTPIFKRLPAPSITSKIPRTNTSSSR